MISNNEFYLYFPIKLTKTESIINSNFGGF